MSERRQASSTSIDRRDFLVQSAGALTAMAILPDLARAASMLIEPMSVGIIGLGRQGRAILAELQRMEHVNVAALCDTDGGRLETVMKRVQGATGYASHKELLDKAKDVRALIIATPTHLHRGVVVDSLGAGRSVYCEMPLAHSVEDARAMVGAASSAAAGTVFMPGLEGRCNPVYKLARTFFRSDSVRDVVSMRAQQHQKTTWRVPASDATRERVLNWRLDKDVSIGLPGEWGTHQFDVFCWYRDSLPSSVRGRGEVLVHSDGREVHDTVSCELVWEDKRALHYEATLANSYQGRHEIFHGSNATIRLAWSHGWMFKEADAPTQGWEVYANRQQFHNDEGITLIAEATKLASQGKLKEGVGLPNTPLYYALAEFLKSIEEHRKPAVSAEHGLSATALGIAAHRACVTGGTVDLKKELAS